MQNAAGTFKRVTLELGGKSPNIVFADADLDAAVNGAMLGLFLNQGQCCCAGSRLLVEDKVYDKMVERLAAASEKPQARRPVRSRRPSRARRSTRPSSTRSWATSSRASSEGARCVTGGERFGSKGYFIKPTIFADVKDDMKIATEEIFGPVMQVLKFKDVDEVVERANTTDYGLAAAVWTRDIKKAHTIAERIRAGTVWINCYDVFDAAAPFGGFKASGIGRELGEKALDNYTELKTVTVALDVRLRTIRATVTRSSQMSGLPESVRHSTVCVRLPSTSAFRSWHRTTRFVMNRRNSMQNQFADRLVRDPARADHGRRGGVVFPSGELAGRIRFLAPTDDSARAYFVLRYGLLESGVHLVRAVTWGLSILRAVASAGFVLGALAMPTVCFLSAWRELVPAPFLSFRSAV